MSMEDLSKLIDIDKPNDVVCNNNLTLRRLDNAFPLF